MPGRHAVPIDFTSRALPLIDVYVGLPTDAMIPTSESCPWVVECLSCWGEGDEPQFLGSLPTEHAARRLGDLHVHDGRLGTGA